MYWPLMFPYGLYYQNLMIANDAISYQGEKTEMLPIQSQQNIISKQSQLQKANSYSLCLTKQDLQQAGYQSLKKPWNEQQDRKLKFLVKTRKNDWVRIAQGLPGRNDKMCYSRYRRINTTSRMYWKKKQDLKIIDLVKEHGQNWKTIAQHFQKRNAKQIKEHYMNILSPEVNKEDWTLEQDLSFIYLINEYGLNWKKIKQFMNRRSVTQLKNRFFGRIKRLNQKKMQQKQKQSIPIPIPE